MKLPVNEKIKESLIKLDKKWEDLFDENSLYKSLYCLQIIDDLTFNKTEYYFNNFNLFLFIINLEMKEKRGSKKCSTLMV